MTAEVVMRDRLRGRWHRFVEAMLPWYDSEKARQADERSERIRKDAIAARMKAEEVREAYRKSAVRIER